MANKVVTAKKRFNKAEDFNTQFTEKVLFINRCSKVIKGGRKFSFSALIVVGDGEGHIGYGFAKANELTDAIEKAGQAARHNIITVEMAGSTIPHDVRMYTDGVTVILKPAKKGTGIVAGSTTRVILECAGIRDVIAKNMGSGNPLNQVHAAFKALMSLTSHEEYQLQRGVAC